MNYAEEKAKLMKELKMHKEKAEIDDLRRKVFRAKHQNTEKFIKGAGRLAKKAGKSVMKAAEKANKPTKKRRAKAEPMPDLFSGMMGEPPRKKGRRKNYNPWL